MQPYNAAFFGTHEAYFLVTKELEGEEFALEAMSRVMARNLGHAYDAMNSLRAKARSVILCRSYIERP